MALATPPQRWVATAARGAKTLVAACAVTVGLYAVMPGGAIQNIVRDPFGFAIALGTAVVMAAWKFLTWKETP